MNDEQLAPNDGSDHPPETDKPTDTSEMRSPVRPAAPPDHVRPATSTETHTRAAEPPASTSSPTAALVQIRRKMEQVATEFAAGKINRAQFNAIYGRYSEQRAIIERLVERNPDSKAWRQVVGTGGHTGFLRQHFEAQPLYFLVFRHNEPNPLMIGGKHTPSIETVAPILAQLWAMPNRPRVGLARKAMGGNQWLILAMGEWTVTLVMFNLEPSVTQAHLVRDLHADFERANAAALERDTSRLERMVFPQRALVEGGF